MSPEESALNQPIPFYIIKSNLWVYILCLQHMADNLCLFATYSLEITQLNCCLYYTNLTDEKLGQRWESKLPKVTKSASVHPDTTVYSTRDQVF